MATMVKVAQMADSPIVVVAVFRAAEGKLDQLRRSGGFRSASGLS